MPIVVPPPGYVDMIEAEQITGLSAQTIVLAVGRGELECLQRVKNSPRFFEPAELRRWRGLPAPDPDLHLVTTGKQ